MGNIKVLKTKKKEKESGVNVIKRLEEILAMAKEGIVDNVFIVCTMNDDSVLRCWANDSTPFTMIGAIEKYKLDFIENTIER